MICINNKSSYWPKCDSSQSKSAAGPAGYEYGHYCTQEWVGYLNQMLSDPQVNICQDEEKIKQVLAQVLFLI